MNNERKSEILNENSEPLEAVNTDNTNMKWYVVHTHTGMENKAKKTLEERIEKFGFKDKFGRILIPTETVEHFKNNIKTTQSRKCLPGYILVEMDLDVETSQLVRATPKITGFVGGSKMPFPITKKEAERMVQLSVGLKKTIISQEFNEGEMVKVVEGPFANFQGSIEEVRNEKKKLRVLVSIFGRSTPVELDFAQVEKMA